jgi:16S rRNA processing protein RimM
VSDFFLIAKIVSAYGKKGFLRITSFSDFPERFFNLEKVFIDFFDQKKKFIVEEIKKHKNFFTIKFKNFDSDSDVKILIDKDIFVSAEDSVKIPNGYFFVHDLIGSKVIRNGLLIGNIKDVLSFPANDVYVIVDLKGDEILLPAVKSLIKSFDPSDKILVLNSGEALFEDDEN